GVVGRDQLGRACGGTPLEPELGEGARELAEVDAVAAGIGVAATGVLDPARGRRFLHDLRESADLVVLAVEADVERLVVDELTWRLEQRGRHAGDVFDVDERPPGGSVAEEANIAAGVGPP